MLEMNTFYNASTCSFNDAKKQENTLDIMENYMMLYIIVQYIIQK